MIVARFLLIKKKGVVPVPRLPRCWTCGHAQSHEWAMGLIRADMNEKPWEWDPELLDWVKEGNIAETAYNRDVRLRRRGVCVCGGGAIKRSFGLDSIVIRFVQSSIRGSLLLLQMKCPVCGEVGDWKGPADDDQFFRTGQWF